MNDTGTPEGAFSREGPATVPSGWGTPSVQAHSAGRRYPVEFTGSGSEYFRIWIVNLLLTLVTLGLYYPWAKVRKLRYFHGNTRLAGHAFDFHGDPKRMLRGYLLVGALFALYAIAGQVSPVAGVIALAIIAALWPALFRASMRFRLANTSWRGLRFQFAGDMAGAYKALLPGFLAVLLFVGLSVIAAPDPQTGGQPVAAPPVWAMPAMVAAMLLFYALLPYTFWLLKRYQHDHYRYASVQTSLNTGPGSFYMLALKASGLMLLAIIVAGLGFFAFGVAGGGARPSAARMLLGFVFVFAMYIVILFAMQPYVTSRLQNLVWSRTGSRSVGFESELRFWPLMRLMVANFFLVMFTLGLYWPFAAVAVARMRLQAIGVSARTDLDALVARGGSATQDASGDAAADIFGVDIGM